MESAHERELRTSRDDEIGKIVARQFCRGGSVHPCARGVVFRLPEGAARRAGPDDDSLRLLGTDDNIDVPVFLTGGLVAMLAAMMLIPWTAISNKRDPQKRASVYDFYTAGEIPTQFNGRIMPLDAYARQTLKAISNRESLDLESPEAYADDEETTDVKPVVYTQEEGYVTAEHAEARGLHVKKLSGTQFRKMLRGALSPKYMLPYTSSSINGTSRSAIKLTRSRLRDSGIWQPSGLLILGDASTALMSMVSKARSSASSSCDNSISARRVSAFPAYPHSSRACQRSVNCICET